MSKSHDNQFRFNVQKNEDVEINIQISTRKNFNATFLKSIPAGIAVAEMSFKSGTGEGIKNPKTFLPFNVSIVAGLSSINLLKNKRIKTRVQVRQYNVGGDLIKSQWLQATKDRNNYSFENTFTIAEDGYMIVSIDNLSKSPIFVTRAVVTFPVPKPIVNHGKIDSLSNFGAGGGPVTNSELPIAWENDLQGVSIIGGTDNGYFIWNSPNEAASIGNASDWTPVGVEGSGSSGGYDGYGGDGPIPGPEEKKIARDANKNKPNVCELAYVLAHLDDRPSMSLDMYAIQGFVENYMIDNNMSAANNGNGIYNAFKHTLLGAMMICELGGTMGQALLNYHETCFGSNMSGSEADRSMDLWNNGTGVSLATSQNCGSFTHLIDDIRYQFGHGGMKDVNGNQIYATVPVVP